ncbi:MAG TPA: HlyD family efflux transporter periplasmic adaptor subunit [Pyrinomonadaceae bacterium]|nr:HlyD family efflux transporter periplasmic adaptor subunit [Pyrinomonadaceae bacterium]
MSLPYKNEQGLSLRRPALSLFSRSTRSLVADSFRPTVLGTLVGVILLAAWASWLFFARISLYEVTQTARLEVDRAAHPLEAAVGGRIVATRVRVGQEVRAGDVLIELDAEDQRLQGEEERAKLATIEPQLKALRDEIAAEEKAQSDSQQADQIAVNEARVRYEEAESSARLAQDEVRRSTLLYEQGIIAQVELRQAKAEAQRRRSQAETLRLEISRLESNIQAKASEHRVKLERLNRQAASLEGQMAAGSAAVKRLGYQNEQFRVRAPVSGRLGEIADLRVGAVIRPGDKLGVIIPQGELKAVAYFLPQAALGRIQPGMPAQLQLEGFPPVQYGKISAQVASVASETRDGQVRVELALSREPSSAIPFQHGLPGSVEVEIGRVSPARLLLQVAGKLLAREKDAPKPDNARQETK